MKAIIPYLNFTGQAKEALALYSKALNGQVVFSQTYAESGQETNSEMQDKIMHASFVAGDLNILVSDVEKHQVVIGDNISLSMDFDNPEEQEKVFIALSEGANIVMPLEDTFWGARFGMLKDKFGITWMFNYDYPKDGK